MLKLLSRRWLGVSGWMYLLSLMLAAFMYWMLPGSPVVHTWNFDGTIRFEGFTRDHRHLVITNHRTDRTVFHQLRIDTGVCTTYLPLQHPDQELDYQLLMKKPVLLTSKPIIASEGPIELTLQTIDKKKSIILSNSKYISHAIGGMTSDGRKLIYSQLSYQGEVVLSDNEHWLIMTRQYAEFWQPAVQWLKKTLSWSPGFLSDGWRYSAAIIDLNTNQEIACPLWTHDKPTYSIHPEGLGFAVLDEKAIGTAAPMQRPIYASTINWYTLPLGPAYHSFQQWCLILGAFAGPVLLTMLLRLFRRSPSIQPTDSRTRT